MVEPVYFTSLEIENVRCFGDRQKLDLTSHGRQPAPWTLILGDNGVGKTTLLQFLAWMRLEPGGYDPVLFNEENDFLIGLRPRIRLGNLGLSANWSIGTILLSTQDNCTRGKFYVSGSY